MNLKATCSMRNPLRHAATGSSPRHWPSSPTKNGRDIINEFDLATAYQRTDRNALAVPLYIDLLDRGRHTRTVPVENFDRSMPPPMLPTLADEAALRLRNMGVTTGLGNVHSEYPALASVN